MDKKILNAEELNYLKHFIKSRGFHDEGTIMEILDHFACKVEDLMYENPKVQFEEAVREAHLSFGVMGFRYIAAAYDIQINKKYKRIFYSELKKTLTNIPYLAMVLMLTYSVYRGYLWSYQHHLEFFYGILDFKFLIITALISLEFMLFVKRPKNSSGNLIISAGLNRGLSFFVIWAPIFAVGSDSTVDERRLQIRAIVLAGLVLIYLLNFLPRYYTFLKAIKEYKELKQYA